VELHALAQLEAPLQLRDLLPRRRQPGHEVELLVAVDQVLIDMLVDRVGQAVVLRMRIHRLGITLARPAQGLRLGRAAQRTGRRQQAGHQKSIDRRHAQHLRKWTARAASLGRRDRAAVAG
jgi:hypothetical protein